MSNDLVHLYALAALLCVCMVTCQNVNTTSSTSKYTTSPPNLTTPTILKNTNTSKPETTIENSTENSIQNSTENALQNSIENSSDYDGNTSSITETPWIIQDNGSAAAVTEDDDGGNLTSSGDGKTPEHRHTTVFISPTITGSTKPPGEDSGKSTVGVIFLVLILIIIIALAVLLYILWRKGRSYSFDLSHAGNDHETPLRSMEHGGTFEHTNKELPPLDFVQEDKPNETNLTANGCAAEADKQAPPSEHPNVAEEDTYTSDTSATPPPKKVEFSLDLDLIGNDFEMVDLPTAETSNQPQNENNNNVSNSGNDSLNIFTEINLDEPQ